MQNKMTICYAEKRGADDNNKYPCKQVVTCLDDLLKVTAYDHVCAIYKGNARSGGNFIESTCLVMDCDNAPKKPSDPDIPPEDWKSPEDVADAFPGVDFYIIYSRNNQKQKGNRPPRPKFHVYFPISKITSSGDYAKLKRRIQQYFPAFDSNALDAARFFYGVENPQGEYFEGLFNVDDIIDILAPDSSESDGVDANRVLADSESTSGVANQEAPDRAGNDASSRPKFGEPLYEGNRNSGLHKIALSLLTKYGHDDSQAYDLFMREADCCQPSLEDKEISTIWHSAVDYYNKEIKTKPDYVTPKQYALQQLEIKPIPSDFSDVGQASLLADIYSEKLRYTTATKWLVYDGQKWNEDELQAQGLVQELTEKQLEYAKALVRQAQKAENEAAESDKDASDESKSLKFAKDFRKFVMMERRSPRIAAALTETRPKVAIKVEDLDRDPFLLNTPAGTVNLRTGKMQPHNPFDYCTKMTAVSPSNEGMDIYKDFLEKLTCGDKEMELYLQKTSGMEIIGKVFSECLEIAYGEGGNGKSSYYDSKQRILGDYAGTISAKILTVSYNQNKKPEIAELRGKRFIIAAELDEDQRLDTAVLKQLCSTGRIVGEKKYKDPFDFMPSHTLALYTNHLPKVRTKDKGTWDRIAVNPFNANFRGMKGEIKNYADYLVEHAGGAILQWMIEGAKMYIDGNYIIEQPQCVKDAIEEYRISNDWLHNFITECCEVGEEFSVQSSVLFDKYYSYCRTNREHQTHQKEFNAALEEAGYRKRKTNGCFFFHGLKLSDEAIRSYNRFTSFSSYPESDEILTEPMTADSSA